MALFFAELFLRGTLLCLLVALAQLLLRRCAATYRHIICTIALCGLLTLPLVQELLPPLPLLAPLSVQVVVPEPVPPSQPIVLSPPEPEPRELPQAEQTERPQPSPVPAQLPTPPIPWLLLVWMLGTALLFVRLTVALFRLRTRA